MLATVSFSVCGLGPDSGWVWVTVSLRARFQLGSQGRVGLQLESAFKLGLVLGRVGVRVRIRPSIKFLVTFEGYV